MPLREHLLELRKRLVLAAIGILLGAVLGWIVYDVVFRALQDPLLDAAAERGISASVNFGGLASAMDMKFKVAIFIGAIVSSPWWLYQLWAFVTPGLTRRERSSAIGFVGVAVPMFLLGAGFAWFVLPRAVTVLTEFVPEDATNLIDAQTYLSFVMRFVLAFGIAFLVPVLMVCLNLVGLVRGVTWLKGWRWAVLISMVFSAIMTPTPDVLTMLVLAAPTIGLYMAAVGLSVLRDRRVDKRLARAADDGTLTR
ncbi:twin-arginine translocase subunit TatC [Cellulomonas triticagri]|uniref:Sec-independent protein translocase protein TatC n=2 Tax=Cellulomonas triticagri TaxID=2483352 RepID=A0A3M2IXB8_9CELL|nr:twin-arginine translocase subunit TatC [Cellulomonas triticagri]RMI05104.1 twin-arginine translocase subunit TatC [Cellulomonas triticagri]